MIENSQAISELMRGAINNKAVYGISYSLIAADQSEYHYLGFQGKNQDAIALEANMQYDLASLTKVVGTTTRILQLLSEGKLDLEDPVGKFINGVDKPKITIKQLLLHRSGLRADIKNVWDFSR
ncbi:serine hydrolase, partial [Oenococcus oeni]